MGSLLFLLDLVHFLFYCLIHSKEINYSKGSGQNKRVINVLNNVEKVIANSQFTKNLAIELGVNENKIINGTAIQSKKLSINKLNNIRDNFLIELIELKKKYKL